MSGRPRRDVHRAESSCVREIPALCGPHNLCMGALRIL
jgi:hypothetical protein